MAEKTDKNPADITYYTHEEVAKHADSKDLWLIIHNKVYDVSNFLSHPGGEEILVENSGKDCTEAFEDIGHSSDAIELMETFRIGEIVEEERKQKDVCSGNYEDSASCSGSWRSWLIPVALGVLATLVYRYFLKAH